MTIAPNAFQFMWDKLNEPIKALETRVADLSRQSSRAETAGAVEVVDALPSAGEKGRVLYLSTNNKLYYDNGSSFVEIVSGSTAARIAVGSYTGTGAVKAVTGVGFAPKVVITKAQSGATYKTLCFRFGLVGDLTWYIDDTANHDALAGLIVSLDSDGFTLSANAHVNQSGIVYYYLCLG
jgi:hypothetical protein